MSTSEEPNTPLWRWMVAKNVTDDALAAKVGVSRSQISRIRRSKSRPRPVVAKRIAEVTRLKWWALIDPEATAQ